MKKETPKKKLSLAKISYGKSKSSFKAKSSSGRGFGRSDDRSQDRRRDSGRSDEQRVSHKIICAECGKEGTVPFKPTSNKPVLCSDCFAKVDRGDRRDTRGRDNRSFDRPDNNARKFDELNKKLDKILELLEAE